MFDFLFKILSDILYFAGYIYGNNAFPPPLSSDEEKKQLKLLKVGNEDARRILIEHNMRLVAHIASKYGDENTSEDLISIGTIGLIKGIDTYNFEKNYKLSPYISRCIENEVLMTLRSNKKRQNDISLDDSIGTDKEGNSLTLADILPASNLDIAEELSMKIETKRLYDAINKVLSPTEKKILSERYGLYGTTKKTQKEIADSLGISRSYVSRIEKKCLKKIYNEITKICIKNWIFTYFP